MLLLHLRNRPLRMWKRLYRMRLINKFIGCVLGTLCVLSHGGVAGELFPKVFVERLPEVNINVVGMETAIPADIWGKTDVKDIQKLIQDILSKPLTPAMQNILTEMMVSKTYPYLPLGFRLSVLMHMGQWEKVLQLIELVPPAHRTDDIRSLRIQALFFLGQSQTACDEVNKKGGLQKTTEQWRLACALTKQDKTGAALIYATHKEQGKWDKVTMALAERLFDDKMTQISNDMIRPYHLPLMASLGDKINWDELNLCPSLQRIAASMEGVPLSYRIKVAEQSVSAPYLKALYLSVPPDVKDANSSLKRALLYQKMTANPPPAELVNLIKAYWDSAISDNMFLSLAPMMYPFLTSVKPSEQNVSLAFGAVQVYALSHQTDAAYEWFQVLQRSIDEVHRQQVIFLTPLMQWLGAGISKEKVFADCQKTNNDVCAQMLRRIDFDWGVGDVNLAFYSWEERMMYASAAGQMVSLLSQNNRQAEALLRAIQALQNSPYFEKEIVTALQKMTPKTLGGLLITERYLLNETKQ